MKSCLLLVGALVQTAIHPALAQPGTVRIGRCEQVYTLDRQNPDVRGMAYRDRISADPAQLFVLDRKNKIFVYSVPRADGSLELQRTHDLTLFEGLGKVSDPRGLALSSEEGRSILYFLDWGRTPTGIQSRLWRCSIEEKRATSVDLTRHMFRIGDREPLDVACGRDRVLVSFDASGYADQNLRVQRGILEIRWEDGFGDSLRSVRHLPDAGTLPCRGLSYMEMQGAKYLWATAGDEHVYCAEAGTGRGLFYFERPAPGTGIAYGGGSLWVAGGVSGPDRLHRVNVTRNPDAYLEGPRVLRRLVMTIESTPEAENPDAGTAHHFYSRPCDYELLLRQGVWPETEALFDESSADNATLSRFSHDPAGDAASRQIMRSVEYASAPARQYSSRYEIDMWTSPYRKYVYPHRANRNVDPLDGADYLADDPDLYCLNDTETYTKFIDRVRTHIEQKYGVDADMRNPYWAARNVVEYIQDSYYYPNREKRKPAAVDYDRKHYDANPANLKIELSDHQYDKSQIIACSGTSVMVAGAMRHLGISAHWLGTGTPEKSMAWDANGNGLLDGDEQVTCTNGHRYSQVWLGNHYGWICFDATPSKPPLNDYDPPPPLQSQWRYMTRAAGGHREENRIVFNVGSELIRPLYRDFEYDDQLAIDNNCGGDQRYNLQGRFEKPALWKLPRHRIKVSNLCSIQGIKLSDTGSTTKVVWQLKGPWDRIPDATLSICLQQMDGDPPHAKELAVLVPKVAASARSASVDLSDYEGQRLQVIIRRHGDPLTGGVSELFAR